MKKERKMKKVGTVLLALLIGGAVSLHAQSTDAASIMNSARNRITKETMSTRSRMVITARNGGTSERVIDQYSKDGPNGARTIIVFQSPATVKDTRFLTMDNASGGSDQWIFLPELNRVRRISASDSGGSFMGTDFSYNDISAMDRDVSLDTHTLLREETFNGNVCYVIQSVPKDNSYQYSKTIAWIDKSSYLTYKAEMYNQRGEMVKTMEMPKYQDVQGRLTAMQITVATVGAGTSTTIYMERVQYDSPIPEAAFTTRYLETGRAQ